MKMRIAILSDIHANHPALEAILHDSKAQGVEEYWALGDIVGYGPHPTDALMFLRDRVAPQAWVMGNHDAMQADILLPEDLENYSDAKNPLKIITQEGEGEEVVARGVFFRAGDWSQINSAPVIAIRLNRKTLALHEEADGYWRAAFTPERIAPCTIHRDHVDYVLVHGTQKYPLSGYMHPWEDVKISNEVSRLYDQSVERGFRRIQLFGHSHVPTLVFAQKRSAPDSFEIESVKVIPHQPYPIETEVAIINPGSVGQPRDLDQRASYAILDTTQGTVTFRKVEYEWRDTARDLMAAEYPDSLVRRLKEAAVVEDASEEWLAHFRKVKTL